MSVLALPIVVVFGFLLAAAVAVVLSFRWDDKLAVECPTCERYRWGYFVGAFDMIFFPIASMAAIWSAEETNFGYDATSYTIMMILWGAAGVAAGYGIIDRRRLGWAVVIGQGVLTSLIFTLNIPALVFALINTIYVWGIWHELSAIKENSSVKDVGMTTD